MITETYHKAGDVEVKVVEGLDGKVYIHYKIAQDVTASIITLYPALNNLTDDRRKADVVTRLGQAITACGVQAESSISGPADLDELNAAIARGEA